MFRAAALAVTLLVIALPGKGRQPWKMFPGRYFSFEYPATWDLVPRMFPPENSVQVRAEARLRQPHAESGGRVSARLQKRTVAVPNQGQGIALDPSAPEFLYSIDRAKREVIVSRIRGE